MHTLAWVAWVLFVMAFALTTTNPFYLGVLLLCVLLVAAVAPRTATAVAGFRTLLLFGLSLFAVSMLVAVINGNYGNHILFTIPGPDLAAWLGGLRLGGPVSGEGLVAAAIRGEAILAILLAFAVFNGAVSPHRVLRTAPGALFHAGLVLTIGLTLLPSSIEDIRRIREVQALRGAPAGLRNLPALVVPAVIGGLERSMRLAEAMEARGYASAAPAAPLARLAGAASVPFFLAAAWGWYYRESDRAPVTFLALLGVAGLATWAWDASRRSRVTRYRPEPLALIDRGAIAASLALTFVAVALRAGGWGDGGYNPFAGLPWPQFSAAGSALALATAWPAARLVFVRASPALAEGPPPVASAAQVRT
ncbi:MAG: energy-coupling factor transporter transmembrane component T [Tepidiformaceae bacterium]